MDCPQTEWVSTKKYLELFNRKVIEGRIPLSGTFDLTRRCNLKCVHCYLGNESGISQGRARELETDEWLNLIDEITEAGCLYLLMTGGEPLLRRDFGEVYAHAKTSGLVVSVFTNGTLITDRILSLFDELPPHAVEISLYGATASTYEKITGVKSSYDKCLNGIHGLLNHNINLELKTILMTHNRHELSQMKNMAKDLGVKFRFDPAIFSRLNGDRTPMQLRVSAKEAIDQEFSDQERLEKWRNYFERMEGLPPSENLYDCGAGLTSFHVDPYGGLQPCVMITDLRYDLAGGSFERGWYDVMPEIGERTAGAEFACNHCHKRSLCGFCPAFFKLESGAEDVCSAYLCAMGEYRFQKIKNGSSTEESHGRQA